MSTSRNTTAFEEETLALLVDTEGGEAENDEETADEQSQDEEE